MRKFFTILLAITFAFALAWGVSVYKKQGNLENLSFKGFKSWIVQIVKKDPKPKLPSVPVANSTQDQEALPPVDPNLSYEEHLEKGDYFFERGFLSFASSEYAEASRMEPSQPEPYAKLLQTSYDLRDYSRALESAQNLLKLKPGQFETQLLMARIQMKLSQFDQALLLLDSLDNPSVPDARVRYYKALLRGAFGQNEEAKKLFEEAKNLNPDADLSVKIDSFLEAFTEFEFAQEAEPAYLSHLLGRAYNSAEEYEITVHLLKQLLEANPELRDSWILFGFAYLNLEKYPFAKTAFEKAYNLDSTWAPTQYFLGLTYKEMGEKNEAIAFFTQALLNKFEPELVVQRHLADLYFETQDYAKAADAYEKILELNKDDVTAFVRPIWLYIDFLNQPQKALNLAQVAVSNFPENAMAHNLLGWSLIGVKEYPKAEASLKKALELDPNLGGAKFNLGKLYEAQKKLPEALKTYQEAYNLDPTGSIGSLAAQAYNRLAAE